MARRTSRTSPQDRWPHCASLWHVARADSDLAAGGREFSPHLAAAGSQIESQRLARPEFCSCGFGWFAGLSGRVCRPTDLATSVLLASLSPGRDAGLLWSGRQVRPVQRQGEAMTTLEVAREAAGAPARFEAVASLRRPWVRRLEEERDPPRLPCRRRCVARGMVQQAEARGTIRG
jgi:hypothetical protein